MSQITVSTVSFEANSDLPSTGSFWPRPTPSTQGGILGQIDTLSEFLYFHIRNKVGKNEQYVVPWTVMPKDLQAGLQHVREDKRYIFLLDRAPLAWYIYSASND